MGLLAVNSRRAFLRLGGGLAALAGSAAGTSAGPKLLTPAWTRKEDLGADVPLPGNQSLSDRLMERHRQNRHFYKAPGGLDPDIAALRSVSPCMKAWMQQRRDDEDDHWWATLREKAGLWW